ncbi:cleavage and polyadenylation specificity factor 73-like, partial [Pollicipes pollicipes]
ASPGMMQSGLSRELFESWCTDPKNGVIIAGYCVEGTLAKHLLSEPDEVNTMSGQKLPLKMSVDYISFSAHTDYAQTSDFIQQLRPPHIVLVHGEQNVMSRLKEALLREYAADPQRGAVQIHNPRNTVAVTLHFRGEKMAKVMGTLAMEPPTDGRHLAGVLVKRNFSYHLLSPDELGKYTDMTQSQVSQRLSVHFSGSPQLLQYVLSNIAADFEPAKGRHQWRLFKAVTVTLDGQTAVLEWVASPGADMLADAVLAAVLKAETTRVDAPTRPLKFDRMHYKECLIETLQEMFGDESVPKFFKGDKFYVTCGGRRADIDLADMTVTCEDDEIFRNTVHTAVTKLYQSLAPARLN